MKKHNIIIGFLFFLIGGVVLSSCVKENNGQTIALIGTEYYIKDILSVIPDSLVGEFDSVFGNIPEGAIPPKIEGTYVMHERQRVYTNIPYNWPLSLVESDVLLHFEGQHNGTVSLDLTDDTQNLTDRVYVMGSGNAFTAYVIEKKEYDMPIGDNTFHVKMKRGIVMAGVIEDAGIRNLRYASIIINADDNSNGEIEQYPPGSFFIYKDRDGLSERIR